MPASNFPFRTPFGCKLQEFNTDIDGVSVKENWLVVEPNTEEGLSDKQKPYCFMADSDNRESSIFFKFAIGKVIGDDLYLLTSLNGESQSHFEIKIQKKEGEKWIEDIDKTKEFFAKWKETGFLTAFHVNGIWNLELLVKVIAEEKVLLKDALKCIFSKKDVPLDILAKVSDQYKTTIQHLKTGKPPKDADDVSYEKMKALNLSMGLPTLVLKEADLEGDFEEKLPCPSFKGELPDSIEALFSPKPETPYQKKEQKSYGMQPEVRMEFLFSNFGNEKLEEYCNKIMNDKNGYMKHLILCQITGLDVGFPSGLVSSAVHPLYINNGQNKEKNEVDNERNAGGLKNMVVNSSSTIQDNLSNPQILLEGLQEDYTEISEQIEKKIDWQEYFQSAELQPKERKKVTECLDECLTHKFINWELYVSNMEIDGAEKLAKSRKQPEVKRYVATSFISLYKVLSSETLQKNIEQLHDYLLHHFNYPNIEMLGLDELKQLQSKLSELDKKASIEEVSLSVQ